MGLHPSRAVSVDYVDVSRYFGKYGDKKPKRWYEKARKPNWFERGMTRAVAFYSVNQDGSVRIKNSGIRDGVLYSAEGWAHPIESNPDIPYSSKSNSRFSVQFSWFQLVDSDYGNYIIMDLVDGKDPEQYDYALVSDKSGSYVWVLSRLSDEVPDEIKDRFNKKLIDHGINTDDLFYE